MNMDERFPSMVPGAPKNICRWAAVELAAFMLMRCKKSVMDLAALALTPNSWV